MCGSAGGHIRSHMTCLVSYLKQDLVEEFNQQKSVEYILLHKFQDTKKRPKGRFFVDLKEKKLSDRGFI